MINIDLYKNCEAESDDSINAFSSMLGKSISQNEYDAITAFLKGKMSKEEEMVFMQELRKNPELKAKAIAVARLVKGMKEVGKEKDDEIRKALMVSNRYDINAVIHDSIHSKESKMVSSSKIESSKKTSKIVSLRKSAKWLSIAASIALVAWFGYEYYDYKKTTGLGEEFAGTFETSLIARGGEQDSKVEKELQRLFDKMKANKDLDNTIHDLSLCWELSKMETYNDYTEYANDIGWNLAIGYLKNNDKKNAIIILSEIMEKTNSEEAIYQKAKVLMNKVR